MPGPPDLSLGDRRLLVEIPTGINDITAAEPGLALDWRMRTREAFVTYLGRGYRVVDFFLSREARRGHYLLTRTDA